MQHEILCVQCMFSDHVNLHRALVWMSATNATAWGTGHVTARKTATPVVDHRTVEIARDAALQGTLCKNVRYIVHHGGVLYQAL